MTPLHGENTQPAPEPKTEESARNGSEYRWTEAERAIAAVIYEVESLGADPLLVGASVLLRQAQESVASYRRKRLEPKTERLRAPWTQEDVARVKEIAERLDHFSDAGDTAAWMRALAARIEARIPDPEKLSVPPGRVEALWEMRVLDRVISKRFVMHSFRDPYSLRCLFECEAKKAFDDVWSHFVASAARG